MKKRRFILILIGVFFLFLIFNLLLQPLNLDEIWNYGFAHNISKGLIPYHDFNMVITPLYPMIMAIFLFIFGSNILVFHIVQAFILTGTSYLIFKLLGKRGFLLLLFFFFPIPVSFPSYNLFLFSLFLLLLYLEQEKKSDYLIGVVLALAILTKQSVGAFLLVPTVLYYFKDKVKIGKRIVSCIGVLLLFVSYLLSTGSFSEFFNLCFLGLFDFASDNGGRFSIYMVFFFFMIVITSFFIKKDSNNIYPYYCLAFYSVMIPLFDTYHFQIALLAFVFLCLSYVSEKIKIHYFIIFIISFLGVSGGLFFHEIYGKNIIYPNDIRHFEYKLLDYDSIQFTKEVNAYLKKHKEEEFIFLNSSGYYFRIANDMPIGYLDLINQGNWGYGGSDVLFSKIKEKKKAIFIVDASELSEIKQTDKRVLQYVMEHGEKIDTIRIYDIYILE